MDASRQWVKRDAAVLQPAEDEQQHNIPESDDIRDEQQESRGRILQEQDEAYQKSMEADRRASDLRRFNEKVQESIMTSKKEIIQECLDLHARLGDVEEEERCKSLKSISCNLLDVWYMTYMKEDATEKSAEILSLFKDVLASAESCESSRQIVLDFISRVMADPQVEDFQYRHRIMLASRDAERVMGYNLGHMARRKVEQWKVAVLSRKERA